MKKTAYEKLLKRIDGERSKNSAETDSRFELPPVDVMWEGQRTYLRNFSDFPKIMRRDSAKLLQYLSKEFAVPAERIGDSAMFVGRRDPDDFTRLLKIYVNDYIMCPTCKSPDTRTEKEKRISFLICEACGAKSTIKGKYS
jgi:translation initiation factor 2 subunit 2